MAGEQLLRPDNRFLNFSIGDLSNYGGQPDATVSFRPAPPDTASEVRAPAETAVKDTPADTASHGDSPLTGNTAASGDDTASAAPAPTSMPEANDAHHPIADTGPLVPSPVGSATSPVQLLAPDAAAAASHPAVASGLDSAATLSTSIADSVHDAVQPITTLTDATAAFVVDSIGSTSSGVDAAVGTVASSLVSTLGATDTIGSTAGDLAPPSAATPELDLTSLGGADPAAGVTTLVDMVTSDNLFDLRDAGAPETAPETPSSIDQLIGDSAEVSPLLGDAAHHGEATDTGGDMHHDFGI